MDFLQIDDLTTFLPLQIKFQGYSVPSVKFSCHFFEFSSTFVVFGWLTKVYVWKRSGPSNGILHRFCLTKGSTKSSQESHPRSVVYVSKLTRAIWRYLLSEFRALLCLSSAQLNHFRKWQCQKFVKGQRCQRWTNWQIRTKARTTKEKEVISRYYFFILNSIKCLPFWL